MKEYIVRYENECLQFLPDKMQELVRCKDCKRNLATPHNPLCQKDCNAHEPYWFCADGERKSD